MPQVMSELTEDSRFFGLFVGRSGAGKTVAEASFPKPSLTIDFDLRMGGVLGANWISSEERKGIFYESFPPLIGKLAARTPEKNYEKTDKLLDKLQAEVESGVCKYKTICLSSMTSMNYAFILDAILLKPEKGKKIGSLRMAGPEDYGFEATMAYNVVAFLKGLRIPNIIIDAHIVDKYGKDPSLSTEASQYADKIVVGSKLSIRDKIGENILQHFNHIFEFEKDSTGRNFFVTVRSDLARTAFMNLSESRYNITNKNFYDWMMQTAKQSPMTKDGLTS